MVPYILGAIERSFFADAVAGRVTRSVSRGITGAGIAARSASAIGEFAADRLHRPRVNDHWKARAAAAAAAIDAGVVDNPNFDFLDDGLTPEQIEWRAENTATMKASPHMAEYMSKFMPVWSQAGFATSDAFDEWMTGDAPGASSAPIARSSAVVPRANPLRPNPPGAVSRPLRQVGPMAAPQRGLGGNVSPLVINRVVAAKAKPPAAPVTSVTSTSVALAATAATAERQGVKADNCVPRPTGNPHGPGKYRGQWFSWCEVRP